MFGTDSLQERSFGWVWGGGSTRLMENAKKDHSLVVLGVHRSQIESLSAKGWFVIPNWVSGEVDLPLDPSVLNSRSVRSDFQKIAEHKLSYEVTRDPARFESFYREMHVPYTQLAHGASAHIELFEEFQKKLGDWELLLVKNEEQFIAGQLITYAAAGPRFYLVGVRDGNREFVKEAARAGGGLPVFFPSCGRKRISQSQPGFFRGPSLNDGVLRYKQKLAQRISGCSGAGLALTVLSYDPAARSFLRKNPFIFRGQDGLRGGVFLDAEAPLNQAEIGKLNDDYLHPGMAGLSSFRFPAQSALSQAGIIERMPANPGLREGGQACSQRRPRRKIGRRFVRLTSSPTLWTPAKDTNIALAVNCNEFWKYFLRFVSWIPGLLGFPI